MTAETVEAEGREYGLDPRTGHLRGHETPGDRPESHPERSVTGRHLETVVTGDPTDER